MSQHILKSTLNNEPIEILVGWDKPLQRFFMVITKEEKEDEDEEDYEEGDEYIYTNLDDINLDGNPIFYQSLDYFKNVIAKLNIPVDKEVWDSINRDKFIDE